MKNSWLMRIARLLPPRDLACAIVLFVLAVSCYFLAFFILVWWF